MTSLTPDQYMALLVERQAAHCAEHGPHRPGHPALLEWFVREGDEDLVDLAAIEAGVEPGKPKRETRPRSYRPASHWRGKIERIDARLNRLNGLRRHDTDDSAAYGGIGIRQTPRQQVKYGARIENAVGEYARLTRLRSEYSGKLRRAERREAA